MVDAAFHVSVSGHQQLGGQEIVDFVTQQFQRLLTRFQEQARQSERELVVYSAVAMGADRLFVKTALDFGVAVELVIPCARYEEIFSLEEREEYQLLVSKSRRVHRLTAIDCSDDAFLAAGCWLVENSDVVVLAWNGYPAAGKGGTAELASYARFLGRPWIHLHTRLHTVKEYPGGRSHIYAVPRRDFAVEKRTVYQGDVLAVNRYRFRLPDGEEFERDVVERPESVLVLPLGRDGTVLLIEEPDLGAGTWQLTIPGGRAVDTSPEGLHKQAEIELREETGFRPGRVEKLLDLYGHPGYMAHKVHVFVAYDLDWDPLEMEDGEEIRVVTLPLEEALEATKQDYRCDPEAALVLWLYAGRKDRI